MSIKGEIFALVFGVLLIMVTFGDNHIGATLSGVGIGNLDTVFGKSFWPVLDVIYPLASIAVFLGYGWVHNRKLQFSFSAAFLFASFLILLALVNIDDISVGLRLSIYLPQLYRDTILWVYPTFSATFFLLFGKVNKITDSKPSSSMNLTL